MKIYLASFLQPENHGAGRKIAIANTKPDDFDVDCAWAPVIPHTEITQEYRKKQLEDQRDAAEYFVFYYKKQLTDFFDQMKTDADTEGKTVLDLIPLKDGDTLLSWERYSYTNYRSILASYLKDFGIEVIVK